MLTRIITTIICISLSTSLFATSLKDSTGVENYNGKAVIIHKVEAKESYFSIGRKYAVSPKIIMDYNANINLQIGTILKIPTERPFAASSQQKPVEQGIIEYKVGPKETLLMLAEHFHTTVDDIRQLNGIKGSLLSIGQVLKIRQGSPAAAEPVKPVTASVPPVVAPRDNTNVADSDSVTKADEARLKNAASKFGLRELTERGVAVTIDDNNVDGSKMLALHRTAPVGTVIKITNPMTGKSTFAKVVGKFTENESTKDVIIVISKAAANLVGALDKRFQVNIVYGVPNEY